MCFHLMTAYRPAGGKGRLVFDRRKAGPAGIEVILPCGSCIQCRATKARDWAVRAHLESKLEPVGCSITLTYAPEFLPPGATLAKRDVRNFMQRVWYEFPGRDLRFLLCGEYGERGLRPHYHLCLWGEDFSADRKVWSRSPAGLLLYLSRRLTDLWGKGICAIGDLNYEAAAYCARYVMKKITGPQSDREYLRFKPDGQPFWVEPVFARMSRRPGLGGGWVDRYWESDAKSPFVIVNGAKVPVPRYCVERRFRDEPDVIEQRKLLALQFLKDHAGDYTPERIKVREAVMAERMSRLHRALDKEGGYDD